MHLQSINNSNNTNFKSMASIAETGNLSKRTKTHAKLMGMLRNSEVVSQFGANHDFTAKLFCNSYTMACSKSTPYYRYSLEFIPVSNPNKDQTNNIPIEFDVLTVMGIDKNNVYKKFRNLLQSLNLENILTRMNDEIKCRDAKVDELLREHQLDELARVKYERSGSQPTESARPKTNKSLSTW